MRILSDLLLPFKALFSAARDCVVELLSSYLPAQSLPLELQLHEVAYHLGSERKRL